MGGRTAVTSTVEISGAALAEWARAGRDALQAARVRIDALNVFPVPDGDTGTNLYLTSEAAVAALDEALSDDPALRDDAARLGRVMARGALLGARGNSGVILSELWRGFVSALVVTGGGRPDEAHAGVVLAEALGQAAASARAAVAAPVEGTILTVADAAARAAALAAARDPEDPVAVIRAAAEAARLALAGTTDQLPALRQAGVVDSGGQGLVVLYDVLERVLSGDRETGAEVVVVHAPASNGSRVTAAVAYEVMFLFEGPDAAADDLRRQLSLIGDSVVVAGDAAGLSVHAHTADVGAVIETAMALGRPHRIVVSWLGAEVGSSDGRGVVVVTHGPGVSAIARSSGAVTVAARPREAPSTAEVLDAIRAARAASVIVLPSDSDSRPVAEAAARLARQDGIRVTVVPTRSIVQSLAALAVHDPDTSYDEDVVAMTRAALATRYGAVTTAVREAITSAGTCRPGDVLGILDGDVVEIGEDETEVALALLERMLQSGGELVSVVRGAGVTDVPVARISRWLRRAHPGVELVDIDGGQPLWPLIVGVE